MKISVKKTAATVVGRVVGTVVLIALLIARLVVAGVFMMFAVGVVHSDLAPSVSAAGLGPCTLAMVLFYAAFSILSDE